ncbi:MAG: ribose 5-phosphate isomerase B [Proteobacteria bacterium]|nr:ribose 5-phosphate isomerase B [Pseudomonadota bacterium]
MADNNPETDSPIIIGCDHAAYALKDKVVEYLQSIGRSVEDVGTHGPSSVNYTDYGMKVASAISSGKNKCGILICGTGLGMSMIANRYPNVRAALCSESFSARMSRLHNNANILVMGARVIGESLALDMVRIWLETPFEGGRHLERIQMFETL